jgi:hypothetical protein
VRLTELWCEDIRKAKYGDCWIEKNSLELFLRDPQVTLPGALPEALLASMPQTFPAVAFVLRSGYSRLRRVGDPNIQAPVVKINLAEI